jgi:hypothetical protein
VPWRASAFEDFLRLETAVPLLVDHGALIESRGVIAEVGAFSGIAEWAWKINRQAEGWGLAPRVRTLVPAERPRSRVVEHRKPVQT